MCGAHRNESATFCMGKPQNSFRKFCTQICERIGGKAEMNTFSFFKGIENFVASPAGEEFDWQQAASKVRAAISDAMNARNVAFLLGSGCSSYQTGETQVGVPTMASMASAYINHTGEPGDNIFVTEAEKASLQSTLGLQFTRDEYSRNLEMLMEMLYSHQFVLERSDKAEFQQISETVNTVIAKVTRYILLCCTEGPFTQNDETVLKLYQSFYRKLVFRDRALPRPWVFTTNYDVFNETAMDRIGIPYCNGFSGTVERRFNPATFRYSLAEQLDITSRKWTAVDNFVYLCKLHGSVNWIEEGKGLFPIREINGVPHTDMKRLMIYPAPTKKSASLGSPYFDLFREFQSRIVREQSVLFVIGYSFSDEHINNIIFQALTVPTFRLIIFLPPDAGGVPQQLRELNDPRIWMIGGHGPEEGQIAHYFSTVVEKFMPELPSDKVNTAVSKVSQTFVGNVPGDDTRGGMSDD